MIRLEAVRLVNWYHFADETLRLGGSCLFLGDNGSGKSTILDALQPSSEETVLAVELHLDMLSLMGPCGALGFTVGALIGGQIHKPARFRGP